MEVVTYTYPVTRLHKSVMENTGFFLTITRVPCAGLGAMGEEELRA